MNRFFQNNEILFVTSYPPRECGIATFTQDIVNSKKEWLSKSFEIKVCALETADILREYPSEVDCVLNSNEPDQYKKLARRINTDEKIKAVYIQHEFGLFGGEYGDYIFNLMENVNKPMITTFHTVLPEPNAKMRSVVEKIIDLSYKLIVMTENSSEILIKYYNADKEKINIISHGTHPIELKDKDELKEKYGLQGKKVLSTFGLLSSNKNLETAIVAMKDVVKEFPDAVYLIMGKTHPEVVRNEGEIYRYKLERLVGNLGLTDNVKFINKYFELDELMDYLQLTDIYLFTSKDKNQAVSGTFSYALSAACPVIATSIPHAKELLTDDTGVLVDFENPEQFTNAILKLLNDPKLAEQMGINALHKTNKDNWKNVAIKYARLTERFLNNKNLVFNFPKLTLKHIKNMTKDIGIVQFSKFNIPDISSGYTLDDNARALSAICMHYDLTGKKEDLELIAKYLNFIERVQQEDGSFLNYIDINGDVHVQNNHVNLEDSNGRAIWALGSLLSIRNKLPISFVRKAKQILNSSIKNIDKFESPRALSFAIKGLYYALDFGNTVRISNSINTMSSKLFELYRTNNESDWNWFEEYLTYGNSIIPEALLYSYLVTGDKEFKQISKESFDFLLTHLFEGSKINVISNDGWFYKEHKYRKTGGQQPIDVSYTIQTLYQFYQVFSEDTYLDKMYIAFSWFLGNNRLDQIIYNPLTGGCYDGLERCNVNLNQGAESTICYIMARLVLDKLRLDEEKLNELSSSIKLIKSEKLTGISKLNLNY